MYVSMYKDFRATHVGLPKNLEGLYPCMYPLVYLREKITFPKSSVILLVNSQYVVFRKSVL